MNRRALLVFLLALGVLPAVSPAAAEPEPDFIAINPRGVVPVAMDGGAFVFTADLFSLTTGEKIGTFTDRGTCSTSAPPPCLVFDVVTTFRLPGGDVVNRAQVSAAPDPTRPGFAFVAFRPATDTIVSGTGRFAGRTGRVTGWGDADMRDFPRRIGLDVFTVIRFNPADSKVPGSRELFAGSGSGLPGFFPAQHFRSEGVNESTDPTRFLFSTDVFSLSDGSLRATVKDEITCSAGPPPCVVLDVTTVIRYPDGEVTARSQVPLAPDPQRPGFAVFATRPTSDNIVSGTGAYAGRTGRFLVNGSVDMRSFPDPLPFEGLSRLVFN